VIAGAANADFFNFRPQRAKYFQIYFCALGRNPRLSQGCPGKRKVAECKTLSGHAPTFDVMAGLVPRLRLRKSAQLGEARDC
jgi:hypothetical protein